MKKSSASRPATAASVTASRSSNSTSSSQPLEKVKTDSASNIPPGTPNKKSAALSKNLSKSQDNLASILRKKAAAATLAGNKENIRDRVLSPAPPLKVHRPAPASTTIRKAQSTHSINDNSTPIKRAQSAQNISKAGHSNKLMPSNVKISAVKRASSTQHVNNKGAPPARSNRASAPAQSMAHNAELLATFEKERRSYEQKISELIQCAESKKVEIEVNKFRLKHQEEETHSVRQENRLLREKLQEMGVPQEHLTDHDKLQMLSGGHSKSCATDAHAGSTHASSAHRDGISDGRPESERGIFPDDASCMTPDHPSMVSFDNWDTKSNKSSDAMSEISLACLQDRISQMEETHYCTNEELEATRMELADLQDNVNELTLENENLAEDKSILLESLCTQTEKLENCRLQIEHLKTLFLSDTSAVDRSQREKQLVELIQSAKLEKDELLLRERDLLHQLHHAETQQRETADVITALRDTSDLQARKLDELTVDKRALEYQLCELKDQLAKDHIEGARTRTLLDNERQKVAELEQERAAGDRNELEQLLDSTRSEKERLEEKLTNVQEELAVSSNEAQRLTAALDSAEREMAACVDNSKAEVSLLSARLSAAEQDKVELAAEAETLREHVDQLTVDCDRYLEDSRAQGVAITTLEDELRSRTSAEQELDKKIRDETQKFVQEKEDWEQFQLDLQLAVKVAADFKSEAQEDMERLQAERSFYKGKMEELQEEVCKVQDDLSKLKNRQQTAPESDHLKRELRGKMICTVDRELAALRYGQKLTDPRSPSAVGKDSTSVKHLIATIEKQVKTDRNSPIATPTSQEGRSRRNSTDSTISMQSEASSVTSPKAALERRISGPAEFKSVIRRTPESKAEGRPSIGHRHTIANIRMDTDDSVTSPTSSGPSASSSLGTTSSVDTVDVGKKGLTGILSHKSAMRKGSLGGEALDTKADKSFLATGAGGPKTDPLAILAKQYGGSKRNALLKWCQNKLQTYPGIDITNFSSSWNDGLAFCALLHSYRPNLIPYKELNCQDQVRNFTLAFHVAKNEEIPTSLDVNDMVAIERPDWQAVMSYITNIFKHFELES